MPEEVALFGAFDRSKNLMVREKRLELLRNAPLDPKSSAFTNSATLAKQIAKDYLIHNRIFCKLFFKKNFSCDFEKIFERQIKI